MLFFDDFINLYLKNDKSVDNIRGNLMTKTLHIILSIMYYFASFLATYMLSIKSAKREKQLFLPKVSLKIIIAYKSQSFEQKKNKNWKV